MYRVSHDGKNSSFQYQIQVSARVFPDHHTGAQ